MSVVELFDKVKGVNIFDLKSYMEPTDDLSINSFFVILNDLFVNLPMFLLNLVVGFFSLIMQLFESFDLVAVYETYIYTGSREIWKGFIGGNSIQSNSVVWVLFSIVIILAVLRYLSGGNFVQRVMHLLAVLLIGFVWFGSISSSAGGLYILRGIRNASNEAVNLVSSMKITMPNDEEISFSPNFSDTYIAETSFKTYLFLNTGRTDGKFTHSSKETEPLFDSSKVLGTTDKNGKFNAVKSQDRSDYLDSDEAGGHGADEGKEANRWVSAIFDYIPIRMFYVLLKIVEAIIKAVPILLIYLISFMSQLVVLGLMLLLPFALVLSFVPFFQSLIFQVVKGLLISSFVPSGLSIGLLMVFLIDKVIAGAMTSKIKEVVDDASYTGYAAELFILLISIVISGVVYVGLWYFKGPIFRFFFGHQAGGMIDRVTPNFSHIPMRNSKHHKIDYDDVDELGQSATDIARAVELGINQGMADFMAQFEGFGTKEDSFLADDDPNQEQEKEQEDDIDDKPEMWTDVDIDNTSEEFYSDEPKGTTQDNMAWESSDHLDTPIVQTESEVVFTDSPIMTNQRSGFWEAIYTPAGDDNQSHEDLARTLEKMRGD